MNPPDSDLLQGNMTQMRYLEATLTKIPMTTPMMKICTATTTHPSTPALATTLAPAHPDHSLRANLQPKGFAHGMKNVACSFGEER